MTTQGNDWKYIEEKNQTYQKNCKEHVERMQDDRLPKLALKYQPVGERRRGSPKTRWKYQFFEEGWGIQN
jgi:hypothetical protein